MGGWLALAGASLDLGAAGAALLAAGVVATVTGAVHHAEVVAQRVGEPYGTLVLAVAVTFIEVALVVSLMLAGGPATRELPRDTVFASVMIMMNGIVGACLLVGGLRHREQAFGLLGTNAALATLATILVLTLILPNYTLTVPGPYYSRSQLSFIAVVSLVVYGTFVLIQTVRHREYFLSGPSSDDAHAQTSPPGPKTATASAMLLLVCLGAVVLLAKSLAPDIERAVVAAGAPKAVVGILIASIVALPEGVAALRAALADRLQTSLNLALGSALASIGLTIPAVAAVSLITGWTLTLGLDLKSTAILALSLFILSLSLGTGRTTVLQGTVLLVIFAVYLFVTIVP